MKKICEFLNCKEEGIYPAPRSRKDITNYKINIDIKSNQIKQSCFA